MVRWIVALCCCIATWAGEPLRIAYFDSFPPYSFREHGEMRGVLIELLDEALGRRMGVPLRHEGYAWLRAQALVREGHADALFTMVTAERLSYAEASTESPLSLTMTLFTYRGHPRWDEMEKVRTPDQLASFRVASYYGNGWAKTRLANIVLDWRPTDREVLRLIAMKRYDLTVISPEIAYRLLSDMNLSGEVVQVGEPLERVIFHLLISRRSPYLPELTRFDEAVRAMRRDGTLARILEKWGVGG
ncbi:substrate-binding periplasmic protein [Chitinimonas lacunae]|uniref:Substrate-binding periplasmic protein n=1 Tax=Chitinimonas lacunae TaxID=1963018 RepID=A0ABV8MVE2_9NEIS